MTLSFFRFSLKERKFFLSLTLLYTLYVLPIAMADRYYNDDLSRALKGATGWNGDGRPLTELLIRFLTFGRPATDISPLPLILSVVLLSWCMTLYFREHILEFEASAFPLIGGCALLANPFLLSDLSYKYDCISIVLSMALCLFVFSLPELAFVADLAVRALVSLAVLCLFQPSTGIFLALIFADIFFRLLKGKKVVRMCISSIAALALSLIFYVAVIAPAFVDDLGWRAEASSIGLSFETISRVLKDIYILFAIYYEGIPVTVLIIAVVLFIMLLSGGALKVWRTLERENAARRKAVTLYVIFLPFILGAAGLAPLMVLNSARISEHMLIAVSVPLMFTGALAVFSEGRLRRAIIITSVICLLFAFSYSYTYGNALKSQKVYETYVTENIARDIERIDVQEKCTRISVSGRMPRSRQLKLMCEKYPQLANIVQTYLYGENWIGTAFLYHYLQVNLVCDDMKPEDEELISTGTPDIDNSLYQLYLNDDKILLIFK